MKNENRRAESVKNSLNFLKPIVKIISSGLLFLSGRKGKIEKIAEEKAPDVKNTPKKTQMCDYISSLDYNTPDSAEW